MIDRPWLNEPDYLEFESDGFPCHIKRHNHRPEHNHKDWLGHLCGYVGVYKRHPVYGKKVWFDMKNPKEESDSLSQFELDAHGGITYAETDLEKGIHWLGFDCAHAGDLVPGIFEHRQPGGCLYKAERINSNELFRETYKDIDFVKAECESLAEQLKEIV